MASRTSLLHAHTQVRSQSGRVIDETIDGVDPSYGMNTFRYDAPGRLVEWNGVGYGYWGNYGSGCAEPEAGRSTNRNYRELSGYDEESGESYVYRSTSCYDAADRLTSSADPYGSVAYDAHANTTAIGSLTFGYDGADRHLSTSWGSTTVTYRRDAADRIVERTAAGATTRYGYTSGSDAPAYAATTAWAVIERYVSLPGGVLGTKRASGDVWSYPNLHGDVMATTNVTGTKVGPTFTYDPNGTPQAIPDNARATSISLGWDRSCGPTSTRAGSA